MRQCGKFANKDINQFPPCFRKKRRTPTDAFSEHNHLYDRMLPITEVNRETGAVMDRSDCLVQCRRNILGASWQPVGDRAKKSHQLPMDDCKVRTMEKVLKVK